MGIRKSICRWFRMKKIEARVDRKRYEQMRNGTYDFSLEGTPKPCGRNDHGATPVQKLEIASNIPTTSSEDDILSRGFSYSSEDDDPCLWNATRIDQNLEDNFDSDLPSPVSTVRSQELQQCLEELPPLKACRVLGLRDPGPRNTHLLPEVSARPPSLESLPPLSPLVLDFEDSNRASDRAFAYQGTCGIDLSTEHTTSFDVVAGLLQHGQPNTKENYVNPLAAHPVDPVNGSPIIDSYSTKKGDKSPNLADPASG